MLQENKEKDLLIKETTDDKENYPERKGIWDKIKNLGKKRNDGCSSVASSDVDFITSDSSVVPKKEIIKKLIVFGVVLAINIFGIFFVYALLVAKEKVSLNSLKDFEIEKNEIEKQIESLKAEEEKIASIQNDIELAGELLDKHIYWDKFFKIIEERTAQGVKYKTFNIDITGQLKLDAVAENFEALSRQLSVFNKSNDYFSDAEMSSISIEQDKKTGKIDGIKFFMSLNVNPDVFYRK